MRCQASSGLHACVNSYQLPSHCACYIPHLNCYMLPSHTRAASQICYTACISPVCCQQETKLGHPVSVLLGHAQPVTFVDFCKAAPEVLLTSSNDGTCRIWDARRGGDAKHMLSPTPLFGQTQGACLLLQAAELSIQPDVAGQGNAAFTE